MRDVYLLLNFRNESLHLDVDEDIAESFIYQPLPDILYSIGLEVNLYLLQLYNFIHDNICLSE